MRPSESHWGGIGLQGVEQHQPFDVSDIDRESPGLPSDLQLLGPKGSFWLGVLAIKAALVALVAFTLLSADPGSAVFPPGSGYYREATPPAAVGSRPFGVCCPNKVPNLAIGVDGVWTWYNDPRAARFGDSTYFGGITSNGTVRAWQFNHASGTFTSFDLALELERDDHDNPTFLQLSNGKIVAFYTQHNGASYYRVSANANSVAAWDAPVTFSHSALSYANPFRMADGSIWYFYRGPYPSNGEPYFRRTNEANLLTNIWDAAVQFIEASGSSRPYIKYRSDGDHTIFMAFTDGHPDSVASNNIYFARLDTTTGKFSRMNGSIIGTTATAWPVTSGEKIWDAATGGGNAWIWDIAIDEKKHPVVVYSQYPGASGYAVADHRYRYARWTGESWSDNEIVPAGGALYFNVRAPSDPVQSQPYYSCGIALDPENPNNVYLSRNSGHNTSCTNLEKWVTTDNGGTWASTSIMTSGNNIRPFVIPGGGKNPWIGWVNGAYSSYVRYSSNIRIQRAP